MPAQQMKAGELVVLRPPAEILATLDETGATDGMPFMPEMLEYYGKAFRVEARAERACDTIKWGVRRIPDTVMLDDLRCSGGAHAGCQAGCRLFWNEAWLRPASESVTPAIPDSAYSELEEARRPQRRVEGLHRRRADLPMSGDGLVGASQRWDGGTFGRSSTNGRAAMWASGGSPRRWHGSCSGRSPAGFISLGLR